jgi:mannose-6-phosphate isomerase-like protein (cupin superfamily)
LIGALMRKHKIGEFTKGWFIGDFKPTLLATKDFETAVKFYKAGDREGRHVHKIAIEFTIIGAGKFRMNDTVLEPGDIVELRPGEPSDFECLESGVTFVVKSPSAPHDKEMV